MTLIGKLLYKLYGLNAPFCNLLYHEVIRKIIVKLEGGGKGMYSGTLRRIMKDYYDVEIGAYSRGYCFEPGCAERFTKIGRYCSVAPNVHIITINHPMDFKSMHEFAWHPDESDTDLREWSPIDIGNDVWIGRDVIILPKCMHIGDGAVIGAGAVVTRDVPPFAIVVGNPARVVRYRFEPEVIAQLVQEKWWEHDLEELLPDIEEFRKPYAGVCSFKGELTN